VETLRQAPVPDVLRLQSLTVNVEDDIITALKLVDKRHSVINTVPEVALTATLELLILQPKIVYDPPAPVQDTLPTISNPERPMDPVVSFKVIVPVILTGCLASPV
jgi:hypothetical protein